MTLSIRQQKQPRLGQFSVFLYGMPKIGKTTEAARFPAPLLLNCEPEGTDFLAGIDVVDVATLKQFEDMIADVLKSDYKTVVVDGLTHMINQAAAESAKTERDNRRAFQAVGSRVVGAMNRLLRGGKIVVATGHSRATPLDDSGTKIEVRPDVHPSLSDDLFGMFSIVCYCYVQGGERKMWTKPMDSDKRLIIAGDRSGVLPCPMPLSADALLGALKATANSNGHEPAKNGKPAPAPQPAPQAEGNEPEPTPAPEPEQPAADPVDDRPVEAAPVDKLSSGDTEGDEPEGTPIQKAIKLAESVYGRKYAPRLAELIRLVSEQKTSSPAELDAEQQEALLQALLVRRTLHIKGAKKHGDAWAKQLNARIRELSNNFMDYDSELSDQQVQVLISKL